MRDSRLLCYTLLLAAVLAVALCPAARAQLGSGDLRGRAPQVIDSALIDLGGRLVYLYGLRGLRRDETCTRRGANGGGRPWDCGQEARGEVFAVCYLGGIGGPELNSWLVEQGWALAAGDYAQDYVAAEAAARAAGRGIWRGQ